MVNNLIKPVAHVEKAPLVIERDYDENGREFIVIEGVRYEAEYFRQFSHPETNVLYQVAREDDFVKLVMIETREEANEFFSEVERA